MNPDTVLRKEDCEIPHTADDLIAWIESVKDQFNADDRIEKILIKAFFEGLWGILPAINILGGLVSISVQKLATKTTMPRSSTDHPATRRLRVSNLRVRTVTLTLPYDWNTSPNTGTCT